MLFNSFEFLVFFPLVTFLFFLIPHKYRWSLLLTASCFFYAFFIPVYILILFFIIAVDYFSALLIEKNNRQKKLWLTCSIITNIGTLCLFKYSNFFITNVNSALNTHLALLKIILPLGLSFHTFQALSYIIEVYRGRYKAERHLGLYALYVMFYPQLIAGPIERPQHIFHQFKTEQHFSWQNLLDGLRLMLWGYFKKAVIADRVSSYVGAIFNDPKHSPILNVWIGIFFFAIQIYCDFSGYSDIAIGSAKTMGYDLVINFNRPFFSKSVTEYWRRWHISLTTWFNDYLFTPIAIDKRGWGVWGVVFAIFITFSISGLWHGAGWTFILFGLLNGIAVIFELLTKKIRKGFFEIIPVRIGNYLGLTLTFVFICFTLIFFRATSFHNAIEVIGSLFHIQGNNLFLSSISFNNFRYGNTNTLFVISSIALMFGVEKFHEPTLRSANKHAVWDMAFCSILLILVLLTGIFTKQSFIYFQF